MKDDELSRISACLGPNAKLLPVRKSEKKPSQKNWQKVTKETCATPDYKKLLRSHGNLGVLLGKPSGGLCSIDIDHDDLVGPFLALNLKLKKTLRTKGRRGQNIWVKVKGDYPKLTKIACEEGPWGEWRSDGGQTVIAGTHPSGCSYEFVYEASPLEIRYDEIKWPPGISNPPELTLPSTNSSDILYNSECSTSTTFLHDTPECLNEKAQATIAAIKAAGSFQKKYPELARLYDRWIENIHVVKQGRRNTSLIEIVTFVFYCVGPDQVLLFAEQYYDRNQPTWQDAKGQHMKEAEHHLKTLLMEYPSTLPPGEHAVYEFLDSKKKAAFRICRDLASRETDESPVKGLFFLSCLNLGTRLGIDQRQAHRILRRFSGLNFIQEIEKGTVRKAGVKGKATTFKWLYSLSPTSTDSNSE